jgi:hypothetical protein
MKMLSKSMLASILSTLVAANVMAQSSGGCPWGSYNRNYGSEQQKQSCYYAPNCGYDDHQFHEGINGYYHNCKHHGMYGYPVYGGHPEMHPGYEHPIHDYQSPNNGRSQDTFYQKVHPGYSFDSQQEINDENKSTPYNHPYSTTDQANDWVNQNPTTPSIPNSNPTTQK